MQTKFDDAVKAQDWELLVSVLKEDTEHKLNVDLSTYQNGITPLFGCIGVGHVSLELAQLLLARGAKRDTRSKSGISLKENVIQAMDYWVGRGAANVGDAMWKEGEALYRLLLVDCPLTETEKVHINGYADAAREALLELAGLVADPNEVALRAALKTGKWDDAVKAVDNDAKMNVNDMRIDDSRLTTVILLRLPSAMDSSDHAVIQKLLALLVAKGLDTTQYSLLSPVWLVLDWMWKQGGRAGTATTDAVYTVAAPYIGVLKKGGVTQAYLEREAKNVKDVQSEEVTRLIDFTRKSM